MFSILLNSIFRMDSYVLAETFKYLYLLFSNKDKLLIDVDDYVFTTEAHLLPLSLGVNPTKSGNDVVVNAQVRAWRNCFPCLFLYI